MKRVKIYKSGIIIIEDPSITMEPTKDKLEGEGVVEEKRLKNMDKLKGELLDGKK